MDDAKFDQLTMVLNGRLSRRLAAGVLVSGGLALSSARLDAKRKKKCKPPRRKCGNRCVAVKTDPNNCGSCGFTCAPGETCTEGTCRPRCPTGQKACDGTCIPATGCCEHAECADAEECTEDVCLDHVCRQFSRDDSTPCVGGECRSGICKNCVARGSSCTTDDQCCGARTNVISCASNFHSERISCSTTTLRCCGGVGARCAFDCDCCEGRECRSGVCCNSIGTFCEQGANCCSGTCVSSRCA